MIAQLYIFTPVFFLAWYFRPRYGLALTGFIFLLSPIFILAPRIFGSIPTYIELTRQNSLTQVWRAVTLYLFSPLQSVTAMCAGMFTGYLIKRQPNLQIPGGRKVAIASWWLASISLVLVIYAWHGSFWKMNVVVSSKSVMAWFVFSKLLCAFWLSYSCYICCTGRSRKCH